MLFKVASHSSSLCVFGKLLPFLKWKRKSPSLPQSTEAKGVGVVWYGRSSCVLYNKIAITYFEITRTAQQTWA